MIKPTSKRIENAENFGSLKIWSEENLGMSNVLNGHDRAAEKQKKLP